MTMKRRVIVVPADNLIAVDGHYLRFAYTAIDKNLHALHWEGTRGHMEFTDDYNMELDESQYEEEVAPYVAMWQAEKDRIDAILKQEEEEYNSLPSVKARKIEDIDAETSAAITAGFSCEVTVPDTGKPETLHFSYDTNDQQNFADTAIAAQASSEMGVPSSISWNAYRNHTHERKGDLVVLTLTAETFMPIFSAALVHKAKQMTIGGQRKAAVAAAQSPEEVEAI